MRKRLRRFFLILLCFYVALPVMAREILQGNECSIAPEQVVEGNLFVLCENLLIEGQVTGNIMGVALYAEISGQVDGAVYLAGGTLRYSGTVGHNLHYAGASLALFPTVLTDADDNIIETPFAGSVLTLALNTELHGGSRIAESLLIGGYQLILSGEVGQELNFQGSALIMDGAVGGDVYAVVGDPQRSPDQIETLLLPLPFELDLQNPGLDITESATITGNLEYRSPVESEIAGDVSGGVTYIPPPALPLPSFEEPDTIAIYLDQIIREASTLISIALIALLLAPNILSAPPVHLRYRPLSSLSVGLLTFILSFPVLLILMILSVMIVFILQLLNLSGVALAAGVMLGLLNAGSIGVFYFVAIFVARVLVGFAIGQAIFRILWRRFPEGRMIYLSMILGILVLALAVSLPVIGWIFNATFLFLGLGSLFSVLMEKFREMREASPVPDAAAPVWFTPATRNVLLPGQHPLKTALLTAQLSPEIEIPVLELPTQPAEDTPDTAPPLPRDIDPGMENLPQGFDVGFFDEKDEDTLS